MNAKRTAYIILTMVLGLIFSYLVHAAVEILYILHITNSGEVITWYTHLNVGSCALHPAVQYSILLIGLSAGYFLGKYWWRIVYIEHRHWSFHNKKNN